MTACGFVTSVEQSQLNYLLGTTFPAAPGAVYLALYYQMPKKDGTGGAEATGTRAAITFTSATGDASSWQFIQNSAPVVCPIATSSQVVGFGIMSASTGGTPLYLDSFRVPGGWAVTAGTNWTIQTGAVKCYVSGYNQ